MHSKLEIKMVSSSYRFVRNDEQHVAARRHRSSSSTSSTSISRKRIANDNNTNVFQAFKRLLFSRQQKQRNPNKNYLIINVVFVTLLIAHNKLSLIAAQAFGAGGYGSGIPAAGTPGGNMFQQAMLLDLLDVNERMREAIMMNSMLQSGALGGAAGGAAGGAYGMNPAMGLTAGDPSLGAAFAAAAAQQVAAASLPQMQMQQPQLMAQFAPQQGAPSVTNKTPYTQFDPLARYELPQQVLAPQQQQHQQQMAAGGGGGSDHPQAALHQAYFAPLQSNVAALGLSSVGAESNAAESGAGAPTLLHRVPRATTVNSSPAVTSARAGTGMMSNRVPFANTGGYQKKKKASSWATPAATLGARGHNASGGLLFKKKHHAAATGPYSRQQQQQQFGGGGGSGGNGFGNHINVKHGKRRPR